MCGKTWSFRENQLPAKSSPNRDILQPNPQITHQIGLNDVEKAVRIKIQKLGKQNSPKGSRHRPCNCQQAQHECLNETSAQEKTSYSGQNDTILSIIRQWSIREQCHGKQWYIHHTLVPCGSELTCFTFFVYLRNTHWEDSSLVFRHKGPLENANKNVQWFTFVWFIPVNRIVWIHSTTDCSVGDKQIWL